MVYTRLLFTAFLSLAFSSPSWSSCAARPTNEAASLMGTGRMTWLDMDLPNFTIRPSVPYCIQYFSQNLLFTFFSFLLSKDFICILGGRKKKKRNSCLFFVRVIFSIKTSLKCVLLTAILHGNLCFNVGMWKLVAGEWRESREGSGNVQLCSYQIIDN